MAPSFVRTRKMPKQREEHTHGSNQHRRDDSLELNLETCHSKGGSTEGCRRQHGAAIALVEVGTHTGHVAHVVAHVVGNGCGVARVVLGDVGLHLTHDVGTHVGSLRVDTATHTGKQGLRRSTHTEGQHRGGDGDEAVALVEIVQYNKPDGDVEQTETHHRETHHGTRTEGNLQTCIQTLTGSVGRTGRGVGGGLHAEETCQSGEETSREEGKRHPGILYVQAVCHEGKEGTEHHKHDGDDLVLLFQIGHSAIAHIECNFFHTRRTLVGRHHLTEEEVRHAQCHHRCDGHEPEY